MKNITLFQKIILTVTVAALVMTGVTDAIVEDVSVIEGNPLSSFCFTYKTEDTLPVESIAILQDTDADVLLFGKLPLKSVDFCVYNGQKVAAGGFPFGVKLYAEGVLVVGTSEVKSGKKTYKPAADAGLQKHDVIVSLNGMKTESVEEVTSLIESSEGNSITVQYRRGEKMQETTLTPIYSDDAGKYQAGLWIRDNTAGLGTVTFYVPETGVFAGLGHGITDTDGGSLIPLVRGIVTNVKISGVRRGAVGNPGELQGYFTSGKRGTLVANTDCGVFGIFAEMPENVDNALFSFALRDEAKEGAAKIRCTIDNEGPQEYDVILSGIARDSSGNKNFVVTITDPTLIAKTGGIVQGMSGSPILQNGKIIGAITHVLINDPTRGYGILIENMLAELPEILKG